MPFNSKSAVYIPKSILAVSLRAVMIMCASAHSLFGQTTIPVHRIPLQTLTDEKFTFSIQTSKKATVIVFLSDECPLSQNYTLTLENLYKEFSSSEISFYAVFAGKYVERDIVADFAKKYMLTFPVLLDKRKKLAQQLGATVTPEVFMLGHTNHLLYRGSIDDWASGLGKKRKEITQHYLKDAILATLSGREVIIKITTPTGCYIE